MENEKEIIKFGKQENNDNKIASKLPIVEKKGGIKNEENLIEYKLDKGVIIKLVKNEGYIFNTITQPTLRDIIEIDNIKSDLIHSFHPPLYKDFITSKGQINTIINIGNIVKVKRKFMDEKEDIPREVTDLYFKSLNNMTVIVAVLNDNDFYVANRLEICK